MSFLEELYTLKISMLSGLTRFSFLKRWSDQKLIDTNKESEITILAEISLTKNLAEAISVIDDLKIEPSTEEKAKMYIYRIILDFLVSHKNYEEYAFNRLLSLRDNTEVPFSTSEVEAISWIQELKEIQECGFGSKTGFQSEMLLFLERSINSAKDAFDSEFLEIEILEKAKLDIPF